MRPILDDQSEAALLQAIEANMFELIKARGKWPRAQIRDEKERLFCLTDVPYPHFNVILRTQMRPEQVELAIQSALEECKNCQVPLAWVIGPATSPAMLAGALTAHGFVHIGDNRGMAVDLRSTSSLPQSAQGLKIRPIESKAELKTWCQVVYTWSGGMPKFVTEAFADLYTSLWYGTDATSITYFLGSCDGEAVAASMLVLAAGVAGFYNVATIPEAQRRGFGSAMTLAAMREARAAGYRIGILHSTEMGFKLYQRLDFKEYCQLGLYVWMG